MPFVRKTDSQGPQPPTDTHKLFIGSTGELLFFAQNILKPEEPTLLKPLPFLCIIQIGFF